MIEDIIEMTRILRNKMEDSLTFLDGEVNRIIESCEQSHKIIEPLLDIFLDYAYMGLGEDQFKRLNLYYKTFNEEGFNDYARYYYEIGED